MNSRFQSKLAASLLVVVTLYLHVATPFTAPCCRQKSPIAESTPYKQLWQNTNKDNDRPVQLTMVGARWDDHPKRISRKVGSEPDQNKSNWFKRFSHVLESTLEVAQPVGFFAAICAVSSSFGFSLPLQRFAIGWAGIFPGLFLTLPSFMLSDSGTPEAYCAASASLLSCFLLVTGGVVGLLENQWRFALVPCALWFLNVYVSQLAAQPLKLILGHERVKDIAPLVALATVFSWIRIIAPHF